MVMWLSRSSRLSTGQSAFLCLTVGFAISVAVMLEREVLPQSLGLRPELTVLGVFGCVVVAMANGANDIANSVGTSYGAKALTLRQAILFGSIAEFTGAVSLGSFVAKSIAKGVIDGQRRGYFRLPSGQFQSDRAAEVTNVTELITKATQPGQTITFTCAPPGSGIRMGIDRDNDGLYDGDELAARNKGTRNKL